MKLVQYNECLISIEDTDDLVLKHQGISSNSADYASMRFPVFKGSSLGMSECEWVIIFK